MDRVPNAGAAALFIPLIVRSRLSIGVSFCARPNIVSRTRRPTRPEETEWGVLYVVSNNVAGQVMMVDRRLRVGD